MTAPLVAIVPWHGIFYGVVTLTQLSSKKFEKVQICDLYFSTT